MTLEFWKNVALIAKILTPIAAVTIILAEYKVSKIQQVLAEKDKKKNATTGTLTPDAVAKEDVVKEKDMIEKMLYVNETVGIYIGENNKIFEGNKNDLKNGFRPLEKNFGVKIPFEVKLKNDTLLVSATFRSLDNNIVAEIIENEWELNPDNYFKRNYDENAIEIIDNEGIIKVQVEFLDKEKIKISGLFFDGNGIITLGNKMRYDKPLPSKEELISKSNSIPNIFRYPADLHFGKRVNE